MGYLRGRHRVVALSLIALFRSATPLDAQPPSREQPRFGGVLKIALSGEPASLDPHRGPTARTYYIMWHVFEMLKPIPHLAEGHSVSHGGRQYTIALRKGVKLHNGKDMTSADFVERKRERHVRLEKDRLLGELSRETDPTRRKAIIDRIQVLFYEDVGPIKFGDLFGLSLVRKELRGDFRSAPFFFFWNAWLEKK